MEGNSHLVYFVKSVTHKWVKIGKSRDMETLLGRVQVIAGREPFEIQLIGISDKYSEKEIHNRLSEYRIRSEWFEWNQKVRSFASRHCNLFFIGRDGDNGPVLIADDLIQQRQLDECNRCQDVINEAYRLSLLETST